MSKQLPQNLIRPKVRESFTEYQRRCPFHTKARCGRCYCIHNAIENKYNNRCNKYNCPFFKEDIKLIGSRKSERR